MRSADIIDDARAIIGLAAGPREWGDTRESWLSRGARKLGMSYARARKVWYRRVEDLWASEWLPLQAKAEEIRQQLQEIEAANARLRLARDGVPLRQLEGATADPGGAAVAVDREEGEGPGAAAAVSTERE